MSINIGAHFQSWLNLDEIRVAFAKSCTETKTVNVVDKWAEYHRLNKEEGMTLKQIGKAKGVSFQTVSWRSKIQEEIPQEIKDKVNSPRGEFSEKHVRELLIIEGRRWNVDRYNHSE